RKEVGSSKIVEGDSVPIQDNERIHLYSFHHLRKPACLGVNGRHWSKCFPAFSRKPDQLGRESCYDDTKWTTLATAHKCILTWWDFSFTTEYVRPIAGRGN